jgi:hypothetical protein
MNDHLSIFIFAQGLVNLDFVILLDTLSSIILLMPSLNLIHHWLTVVFVSFFVCFVDRLSLCHCIVGPSLISGF